MTQPRKAQVNSINTRYTAGSFLGTPGTAEVVISASAMNALAVTDVPGGAEEDVQGFARGTSGPYPVIPGDSFTLRVDGGPPFLISLGTVDTTASRVAAKVNTAASAIVASSQGGRLLIQSLTFGAASSVQLLDTTPGTLAKLGLAEGTFSGLKGPARGILTRTRDYLGGVVPLATADGRHLVTDSYDARVVGFVGGESRRLMPSILGGVPVHGRLTYDGASYRVAFYASFPSRASVLTFNSNFSLLDGTNSLSLNIDGTSFSVTFPAAPYTRDQVIARINSLYAAALGLPDGRASVTGTVSSPFDMDSTDSFVVSVDGSAAIPVTFLGSESTVASVVTRINSVVFAAIGVNIASALGSYVLLESPTTAGLTSSLRVYELSTDAGSGALRKLGIRQGFYRGAFVAETYGGDEIRISSHLRGSGGTLDVSGSVQTLARIGLVSGSYIGSDEPQEEPVPLPYQSVDLDAPPAVTYPVEMIFPEVMDFGDVSPSADSRLQEFLARSAGSNQAVSMLNPSFVASRDPGYVSQSRGLFDVGKPVTVGPDGSIPRGYLQAAFDYTDVLFKQFLRYPDNEVVAIVGGRFETPGFSGNPLPTKLRMDFFADPGATAGVGFASGFRWFVGVPDVLTSPPDFEIVKDNGASPLFGAGTPGYVNLGVGRALYSEFASAGPLSPDDGLKLADANTVSTGGVGSNYIPFTAGLQDGIPRLADFQVWNQTTAGAWSVMRDINARHEVTIGDGISTVGDFTGTDALSQAAAYLAAVGATVATIRVKPGSYAIDTFVNFSSLYGLTLEGYYPEHYNTYISHFDVMIGIYGAIVPPVGELVLRNVTFSDSTPSASTPVFIYGDTPYVTIEDCGFYGGGIYFENCQEFYCRRSIFEGTLMDSTRLQIVIAYTETTYPVLIAFEDCLLNSSPQHAVFTVKDFSGAGLTVINEMSFRRCLSYTSLTAVTVPGGVSSPVPVTLQTGGGLISFEPAHSAYHSGTGIIVNRIIVEDTRIIAGTYGSGSAAIALNLIPSGWYGSSTWAYSTEYAVRIDNVEIRRSYASQPAMDNEAPLVAIGGVGTGSTISPISAWGGIVIDDLVIECAFGTNGRPTANMMPFFTKIDYPGQDALRQGGALCLSGWTIDAKKIRFFNTVNVSRSPDLFLCPYYRMETDGIDMQPVSGGSGFIPYGRLVVRQPYNPQWAMKNTFIFNNYDVPATAWAQLGVVIIEPGGDFSYPFVTNQADPNSSVRRKFSEFYISLGNATPVTFAGIYMESPTSLDNPYTTVCSPAAGQVVKNGGILFENGYVGSENYPGNGMYYGILGYINGMGVPGSEIDNVYIKNVTIDSTKYNGIRIDAGELWYPVVIEDCTVYSCGQADGYSGVMVTSHMRNTFVHGFINVDRCQVQFNNSSSSGVQVNVRDVNTILNTPTRASFRANCLFDGSTYGRINVTQDASNSLTSNTPISAQSVRGAETGYVGGGSNVLQIIGLQMIHNLAILNSNNGVVT